MGHDMSNEEQTNQDQLRNLIEESTAVDQALSEAFGDEAPALTMHAAIGAMADQLEKRGLLDKTEWLRESISRRRDILKT